MTENALTDEYFAALQTRDGARARAIFRDDGVLDDYRGGHHVGGSQVEKLINRAYPLTISLKARFENSHRTTAYGTVRYEDGRTVKVRWVFHHDGERISHLGNSRVEGFPNDVIASKEEFGGDRTRGVISSALDAQVSGFR